MYNCLRWLQELFIENPFPYLPTLFVISPPLSLPLCLLSSFFNTYCLYLFSCNSLSGTSTVSIGVASGIVFCGIVGHTVRHEYTGALSQLSSLFFSVTTVLATELWGGRGEDKNKRAYSLPDGTKPCSFAHWLCMTIRDMKTLEMLPISSTRGPGSRDLKRPGLATHQEI
jgi:hypothetical protein